MRKAVSADGTQIAFDQTGGGPPVILVVGAFNERSTGAPLARALEYGGTMVTRATAAPRVRCELWPVRRRRPNPLGRRRSRAPVLLATSGGHGATSSTITGARSDTEAAGMGPAGTGRGAGGAAAGSGELRWSCSAPTTFSRTLASWRGFEAMSCGLSCSSSSVCTCSFAATGVGDLKQPLGGRLAGEEGFEPSTF
jgi:hypothetical protein